MSDDISKPGTVGTSLGGRDPMDSRPALVMLVNSVTPYRTALHLRLARELPEFRLLSVFSHGESNSPWALACPAEINPHFFGIHDSSGSAARSPVREWRKGGEIIDFLKKSKTACVVLHGYNDAGRIRILRWCHANGIPCFLWGDSNSRSDHVRGLKKRIKQLVLSYIVRRCTGFMVCGSLGREYMVKYGARADRIFYVPYEPDYGQIRELPAAVIESVAEKFGLRPASPERRRVVYSGRLATEKRVDLLIRAFVAIAPERPEWELVIVGAGPLQGELQALVPEELKRRVKWLGFLSDQSVVSAVYRNADVLCLPSQYEPWALVINEAAAAGLAIVASDVVGAAAELVRDDVNGKIFISNDLGDATSALRFVTDPGRIDRLRAGSAKVLQDWRDRGDPVEGVRQALSAVRGR